MCSIGLETHSEAVKTEPVSLLEKIHNVQVSEKPISAQLIYPASLIRYWRVIYGYAIIRLLRPYAAECSFTLLGALAALPFTLLEAEVINKFDASSELLRA